MGFSHLDGTYRGVKLKGMKKTTLTTLASGLAAATAGHFAFWGYRYLTTDPVRRSWTILLGPARHLTGK